MGASCPSTQRSNIDRDHLAVRARIDEHRSRQLVQHDFVGRDFRHTVEMERVREHWTTDAGVFGFDIGEDNREVVAHSLFT